MICFLPRRRFLRCAGEFIDRRKIVEIEQWDQDLVDMKGPGHITFEKDGSSGFHFGCLDPPGGLAVRCEFVNVVDFSSYLEG
jgi:hypothetical protein